MYSVPVLVALGANIGDPEAQLEKAIARLGSFIQIERASSVYRTEPVGILEQPDFLNQVVFGATGLTVFDLHRRTRSVEQELGRSESPRNGPRIIDVDVLAYGDLAITSAELIIPHPRLHERSFVLTPLAEIRPDWMHPLLQRRPSEMLAALDEISAVQKLER